MNKVLFVLALSLCTWASDIPFWRAKPEIYSKMKDERYIAVSAKSEKVKSDKKLSVVAAGIIHAPVDFTDNEIQKYDEYPKFLTYILESPYSNKTKNIALHGAFMGYHVHMTIHAEPRKTSEGREIFWNCTEGNFKGMNGVIHEKSVDPEHTEISMDSTYTGKSLGIPTFILDWGLELAAQRTAATMRTHVESEWQNSKKH